MNFVAIGLIAGVSLSAIGYFYYSGAVELHLGIPPPESPNVVFSVPSALWFLLGALVVLFVALIGFVSEPEFGWQVFTIFAGGSIMVIGYFLYE